MKKFSCLKWLWVLCTLVALLACTGGEERKLKYYERALALYEEGNYEKATIEVKNALQIDENFAEGRYLHALLHEKDRNFQQMFGNLNLAIQLDPDFVDARIKFGQMLFANRLYENAIEQAETVLALEPENPDARVILGSIYYQQNKVDDAIREANIALDNVPGHVGAIAILTAAYRAEDPERALGFIGDGLEKQDTSTTLRLLKISVLEEENRVEEVIEEYQALIADDPENLFFYARLINFYEEYNFIDEAEDLLVELINNNPDNVEIKLSLAQFQVRWRGADQAEQTLLSFLEEDSSLTGLSFALAELYTAQQLNDKAKSVYRRVASEGDGADSVLALNKLVELELAAGNQAEAEGMLEEIFEIEPENIDALYTRARWSLASGDIDATIVDLRSILKFKPADVNARLLLAEAYTRDNARELAIDSYREVLSIQPGNQIASLALARGELASGNFELAERLVDRVLLVQSGNIEANQLRVEVLSRQSRWSEAHETASFLIENSSSAALGYYLQGRVHLLQNESDKASFSFKNSLDLDGRSLEPLRLLIRIYAEQGELEEAENYLLAHIERLPNHTQAHELLGDVYLSQNALDKAETSYQRVVDVSPSLDTGYIKLAAVARRSSDNEKALDLYEKGRELANNDVNLYTAEAGLQASLGKYESAAEAYEAALKTNSNAIVVENNLAMIYLDKLNTPENLERALELVRGFETSDQPPLIDTASWMQYRLGNMDRSITLAELAIERGGDAAEYHYHLGMAYFSNGQTALAKEQLELALGKGDFDGRDEAEAALRSL